MKETCEDRFRGTLAGVTGRIPNDDIAGLVFIVGLLITERVFQLLRVIK